MPKITNGGKTPRAFHVASKGDYVELQSGESVTVTADDFDAMNSPAFEAVIGPGMLVVEALDADALAAVSIKPAKTKKAAPASDTGSAV